MIESNYVPIIVFAFNRVDLCRSLMASLKMNKGWLQSPIYVFIDGPRSDEERVKTEAVRIFFEGIQHPTMFIESRSHNLGLKKSLSLGITHVLSKHDSAIVLEDDLELSQDALFYFNTSLTRYKNDMRVWSVCADVPELNGFGRSYAHFMPVGSSWGWATWSDRWISFSDAKSLGVTERKSRVFRDRVNVHGLRDFTTMLEMDEAGQISSWYVYWHLTIARNGGMSLFPPVPMLRNTGFGAGTHASWFSLPNLFGLGNKKIGRFDFALPDKVEIDFEFTQRVIDSTEWRLLRVNSILGKVKRQLKRVFRAP